MDITCADTGQYCKYSGGYGEGDCPCRPDPHTEKIGLQADISTVEAEIDTVEESVKR